MTVVKIGGDFVAAPDLLSLVNRLRGRYGNRLVYIAGGGDAADLVRQWHRNLDISESDAHWLAVRAMSLHADLVARRLGLHLVDEFTSCQAECVLDVWRELSRSPHDLPVGWHVTSDSLAAWTVRRLGAKKLVLVKAVGDGKTSVESASAWGWVDAYFGLAAQGLVVEWFNPADFS